MSGPAGSLTEKEGVFCVVYALPRGQTIATDLEAEPQTEAEDPLTTHRSVFSEIVAVAVAIRIAPLRCVGEVEGLGPELQVEPLGDSELPEETEIPL